MVFRVNLAIFIRCCLQITQQFFAMFKQVDHVSVALLIKCEEAPSSSINKLNVQFALYCFSPLNRTTPSLHHSTILSESLQQSLNG